jgi:hypothetical protein
MVKLVGALMINGQVAPVALAPPPPDLPPASASSPDSQSGGLTAEQIAAADAAGRAAAAGANALLAGGSSADIAAAEAAAGATPDVVQNIINLNIPSTASIPVGEPQPQEQPAETEDDYDEALAEAEANHPDLSLLLSWSLEDPFGATLLSTASQPLKGGSALAAIAQACADYGVDARACIAVILHEGANGGMGDGGAAYGPTQVHATDGRLEAFKGKGKNNAVVNAWAWSKNGIEYQVRSMASGNPPARGLSGHAAVAAIVTGYERPADPHAEYLVAAKEYDKLVSLGSDWATYAAPLLKGPVGGGAVDTKPLSPAAEAAPKPPGTNKQWGAFIDVFGTTIPSAHSKLQSQADDLWKVFK